MNQLVIVLSCTDQQYSSPSSFGQMSLNKPDCLMFVIPDKTRNMRTQRLKDGLS